MSQPVVPSQRLPLLTRLKYGVLTWARKAMVAASLAVSRIFSAPKHRAWAPTYLKRYAVRPMLESRVFFPKNYVSGSKLPLIFDIHGSGFIMCDPQIDDQYCHYFANEFGFLVIALDYRKAPRHPFPTPIDDCAEVIRAVLADNDLPIDHDRVMLNGFSAGGNLCFAVAQFEDLKPKFKGIMAVYPVTDFTGKYRGTFKTAKDGTPDALRNAAKLTEWAYTYGLPNLAHTQISCVYATREMLPQKIYIVGCEVDCLCDEAQVLAKRLAGAEGSEVDGKTSWNKNGVRWELVPDQLHNFTHEERKGQAELERQRICDQLFKRINAWIQQEVFVK